MSIEVKPQAEESASWGDFLQDVSELAQRMGTEGVVGPADEGLIGVFDSSQIDSPASLRQFLARYRDTVLVPVEMPTIAAACFMVGRGELRELLELDKEIARRADWQPFADASRWVGSCHARSMRGMKDHRTVWRYCEAVRTKEAHGWHLIVYGIVLSAFSIPLRQGIANYCERTLAGFIDAVAKTRGFPSREVKSLKAEVSAELALEIDRVMKDHHSNSLSVV